MARKADKFEVSINSGPSCVYRQGPHSRSESNVLLDRQPGEQRDLSLENYPPVGTWPRHGTAIDLNGSRRRAFEAGDKVKHRRFSATCRPEKAEELAFPDR